MQCLSCGHDNPADVNFCASCGIQLTAEGQCAACQYHNPPNAQFCSNCGALLHCPNCSRSCSRRDVGEGRFCRWCQQFLVAPQGVGAAGIGRRVAAYILDIVLFFVTLIIGYIIWWLFTLSRGQTPGKRLVGIRVMRTDGNTSEWGWTFIREFIVKIALFGAAGNTVALGIPPIVDLLWAFWDKDRQTLHDKIMKTVVVDDRVLRSRPREILA